MICSLVFTACDLRLQSKRLACSSFTPSPLILVFVSSGQRSVSPQRGWSRGLSSSGLKAPFPPTVHLSALPGPPPLRGLHAYHIFKYIRKQRGKKKTVIPYHSRHQRTKILPDFTCFKGEQTTKRRKKKDLLLHWSFVFGNMKAGMFSYFFFRDYAYFIDIYIFLCCLNLCISAIRLKCVFLLSRSFCAFSALITWAQCYGGHLIEETLYWSFSPPVIHTHKHTRWCGSTTLHRKLVLGIWTCV